MSLRKTVIGGGLSRAVFLCHRLTPERITNMDEQNERRCAECNAPLMIGEEWVCESCCPDHLIFKDPNGYMTDYNPPDP